ncbi:unnamed protein product [Aphanomyces euteiches]
MTLRFNLLCESSLESTSLKNKYHSLKAEYSKSPIVHPTYWDEYLGDKNGLGQGDDAPTQESHTSDDGSQRETSQRKREIALEIQRQRKKRKHLKVDIGAGMVQMGETLANGLIEAAKTANTVTHGESEAVKALQAVLNSLEENKTVHNAILQSILDSTAMNRELLQHLQKRE